MSEQDVATRRARDLERYHRRVAKRRAKGLCLKCGKPTRPRPTAPSASRAPRSSGPATSRANHRRTAERIARGLCPKCGKAPPRARDAASAGRASRRTPPPAGPGTRGLRAAGMARPRPPGRRASPSAGAGSARSPNAARGGALPGMRHRAARAGAQRVRTLRRGAACGRACPLREGQGRRQALRGPECLDPAPHRAREERQTPGGTARRGLLQRAAASGPSTEDGTQCEPCREARRAFEHER